MENYIQLARKTLKIMNIKYSNNENLENLIEKIEKSVTFYSTSTEKEILKLTKLIATEIKNRENVKLINNHLSELENEISYLPWD